MADQETVTLTRAQVEELRAIIHNADSPLGNRLQDVSSRLYFALDGAGWTPVAAVAQPLQRREWEKVLGFAKKIIALMDSKECALSSVSGYAHDAGERAQWIERIAREMLAQPEVAAVAQPVAKLPFAIFADELAALHRFYETTEDGQDYTVPVPMMKRLATIGLVRRVTGNRYEFTDFGLSVRNGDFAALAASPSCEQSAIPDRKGVYAWVTSTGHASLVLVDKRPTPHSPGGALNASVMDSSKFYDGCAVESWGKDGRWVLLHDFAAIQPTEEKAK